MSASTEHHEPRLARRSIVGAVFALTSILLFIASLTQDCLYVDNPRNPRAWGQGINYLLGGWAGGLAGGRVLAWLANPALLLAWLLFWSSSMWRTLAIGSAMVALALSLSFLFENRIITSEMPSYSSITGYGPGYWLWVGSTAMALFAGVFGIRTARLALAPEEQPSGLEKEPS
jgi:hypothetical protein